MKILLQAPIFTSSGYGEHSRLVLRSLLNLNSDDLDIYLEPLNWGRTSWANTDKQLTKFAMALQVKNEIYIRQSENKPEYDVQIRVGIPNEFEKKAPYSVCVTAGIETDKVSPNWILKTHQGIDKIIVPSLHAKNGFVNTLYDARDDKGNEFKLGCKCPVDIVPYPFKDIEPVGLDLSLETSFNFLCVAMFGPRKNLENTVRWFLEEFKEDSDVGLVLKVSKGRASHIDRESTMQTIKGLVNESKDTHKCKVYLLHGNLTDAEMMGLYSDPKIDAIVSTTHGEGFGLPLFEAAACSLPVIATDWSAHTEFLSGQIKEGKKLKNKKLFARVDCTFDNIPESAVWENILVKDSKWAYPKKDSFKKQMRKVQKQYGMYKKWASTLASQIREKYTEESVMDQMVVSLLGPASIESLKPMDLSLLPKISLITSVFRAEDYIDQLMEDITRQTVFEKCEWIILNANKPGFEYEEEVILKYKEKFPNNIVYERMEEDPGIYDTWNKGIKMSTGEYITNVNCDDRRAGRGLEKQATALYNNPDVELVYNDSYITHEPNIMFEDVPPDTQKYNFEQFSTEAMLRGNLPHNNPMWKRSIHEKHGYFNQYYKSAGDWDFWLRCAFGGSKFLKHPEVLGVYYFNPTGMSTNPDHDSWKKVHEREIFTNYMKLYQEMQKQEKVS